MQRAVKVKTLCNVPVFAGAFFLKCYMRKCGGLSAVGARKGRFCRRLLFRAGQRFSPQNLSVQPQSFCFAQEWGNVSEKILAAQMRAFSHDGGARRCTLQMRLCGALSVLSGRLRKGRFVNAAEGQFFAAVFFVRSERFFAPSAVGFFLKASAPHGACRQTRKAFFRGRSGRFLRRRKKLGDFHSNLCLCAQKSLNFFEICLNFFQITIEKYLSVC